VTGPASEVYTVRLRPRSRHLPGFLAVPLAGIRNIVAGVLGAGGVDWVAPAVVELTRQDDGRLVGRIPAGSSYYEQADALAAVRDSSEAREPDAFLAEWDLQDG
jgi:hypothetical protein